MEVIGIDHNGKQRKMCLFPKDASPEEIYWMIQEMVWKPPEERAMKENKTMEQVVAEDQIRFAKYNNKVIDVDQEVKKAMGKYQLLLEHRSEQVG